MSQTTNWEIRGAESQTIFGTTYKPDDAPIGCAIVAHGFKGYKDFRMIPAFAAGLCRAGFVAHAFNFSHSGMSDSEKEELRRKGYLESPSARTGQILRIGLQWLTEQEADRDAHNVLDNVRKIECPLLVVHGENDETVNVQSAVSIANAAADAHVVRIKNCNHVFNAPNPPPSDVLEIPELARAIDAIVEFSRDCCIGCI
jgi:pimeloyl-ACP methyl ester carboxylesterase